MVQVSSAAHRKIFAVPEPSTRLYEVSVRLKVEEYTVGTWESPETHQVDIVLLLAGSETFRMPFSNWAETARAGAADVSPVLQALDRAKAIRERIRARTRKTFDTVRLVEESREGH